MSKTIWKYTLPRDGETIEIHEYIVEVLHIGAQDGIPTLWAIVDPDRPKDGYIEVVAWGTGWPLPEGVYQEWNYWGTCGDGGGYIWHYFAAARFSDPWCVDKAITDYGGPYNSPSAGSPDCPYGLTISSDGATSASDWTIATLDNGPPTVTFSLNNAKIDLDKIADMIGQYVEVSNTATNSACG